MLIRLNQTLSNTKFKMLRNLSIMRSRSSKRRKKKRHNSRINQKHSNKIRPKRRACSSYCKIQNRSPSQKLLNKRPTLRSKSFLKLKLLLLRRSNKNLLKSKRSYLWRNLNNLTNQRLTQPRLSLMKPLLRRDSPIRPLLRKILINNWPSSPLRLNC